MRTTNGDVFHKDNLVAEAVEKSTFGRTRGSIEKRVISASQAILNAHYYERRGDGTANTAFRKEDYMGLSMHALQSLVTQRWESTGKASKQSTNYLNKRAWCFRIDSSLIFM